MMEHILKHKQSFVNSNIPSLIKSKDRVKRMNFDMNLGCDKNNFLLKLKIYEYESLFPMRTGTSLNNCEGVIKVK